MGGRLLTVRAGAEALAALRREGFGADLFSSLLGASGGPKWLVLAGMDRVLARRLVGARTTSLDALGTSIGTFRHLALAQRDPAAAIDRFERAYVAQTYEREPTPREVTDESRRIVGEILGASGDEDALAHPRLRLHVGTVRSRGLAASDNHGRLALGLGLAAAANAAARGFLRIVFERVVFHSAERPAFSFADLPTLSLRLQASNLRQAVLASGSIPLVMSAISGIAGAPAGLYRDGGITDYHFAMDFGAPDGLVLYPHFSDRIVPGWFDKGLPWRRARGALLSRTVFVAPAAEWIASLPGAKIPDRKDFRTMRTAERQRRWNEVLARSRELGEELERLLEGSRLAEVAEPFPA